MYMLLCPTWLQNQKNPSKPQPKKQKNKKVIIQIKT